MQDLPAFMAYARDFEQTLADDDWTRLRQYFAGDAVYEVKAEAFGCRLVGPDAIFAGIKKSLDGFDRKFARRDIDVTDAPHMVNDHIELGWTIVYHRDGVPPFTLRGRSRVRYANGKIAYLSDSYDPSVARDFAVWQRESGVTLDPSYV